MLPEAQLHFGDLPVLQDVRLIEHKVLRTCHSSSSNKTYLNPFGMSEKSSIPTAKNAEGGGTRYTFIYSFGMFWVNI